MLGLATLRKAEVIRVKAKLGPLRKIEVRHWRKGSDEMLLSPQNPYRLTDHDVADCIDKLGKLGHTHATTIAIPEATATPFANCGFELKERLHLLAKPLDIVEANFSDSTVGNYRRWHSQSVLAIDQTGFDSYWQFDKQSFRYARKATPTNTVRVSRQEPGGPIVGYAITGKAGKTGYLQRLAVDPKHQRQGLGIGLVKDSIGWLAKNGATRALVNTQAHNLGASALYLGLGFSRQPEDLVVMTWQNR